MSLLNGFQGQQSGRPAARAPEQPQQAWPQQPAGAQPGVQGQPQWGHAPQTPGYGQQAYPAPAFGQGQDYQYPQKAAEPLYANGPAGNPSLYAPQFEPYVASAPQPAARPVSQPVYQAQAAYAPQAQPAYAPQAQGYGKVDPRAQNASQWPAPQQDARGFDLGSYAQPAQQSQPAAYRPSDYGHESEPSLSDWNQQQHGYQGEAGHGADEAGFAQPAGGELDPAYGEEEAQDYEADEPRSRRRPVLMVAALAGAILFGSGMVYGYKKFINHAPSGEPPVIKTAGEPSKIKPADAGGKQFAHTDSKIMGRLGDGSAAAPGGEMDANGTRKVPTLVVGRDGSIQAPAAAADAGPAAPPAVPGMTVVDALGMNNRAPAVVAANAGAVPAPAPAAPQKLVVVPPAAPAKPVTIAKAVPAPQATGSIDADAAAAPAAPAPAPKKAVKKAAAAANDAFTPAGTPAAAPAPAPASNSVATTGGGGNGFVPVLASIPRSESSRLDALKRFADMQQKYGTVLGGKTPDVAEANLGAKGNYHRLVVGPPGSREQANALCSQLKSQGYPDCWVTAY